MNEAPRSIGVIMDGNRRWARERGLSTKEGHRAGLEKIKDLVSWSRDAGVQEIILYTFSTENWNRSEEEVSYLMELFEFAFGTWLHEIAEQGVQIKFMGERSRPSARIVKMMEEMEGKTARNKKGTLVIAFSYGGRQEIVAAVNQLLAEKKTQVTEEELQEYMWSAGISDPDLIIRTSGEQRLSNFLPWQSVYAELFFTKTHWPDFSKKEFNSILEEYASRERRRGV